MPKLFAVSRLKRRYVQDCVDVSLMYEARTIVLLNEAFDGFIIIITPSMTLLADPDVRDCLR